MHSQAKADRENTSRASLAIPGARVDFHWLGDRFGHSVYVVRDDEVHPVCRSVQSGDLAPAFQELHQQDASSGGVILFLSGAGGGAHWSMSVEQFSDSIAFDVAARVANEPISRSIEYITNTTEIVIPIKPIDDAATVKSTEDGLLIAPNSPTDIATPVTLRWKYVLALT